MTPVSSHSSPVSGISTTLPPNPSNSGAEGSPAPPASRSASSSKGRKGHTKSRTGCKTCKKRKVKCDEGRPECGRCIRFGVTCDFRALHSPPSSSQSTDGLVIRRRGRPRNDWKGWLSGLESERADDSPRAPSQQPSVSDVTGTFLQSSSPATLNVDDLELFHHYCINTAMTAGDPRIWRDHAPQLGFEHPCVLHAMLSLSAHHLARQKPLRAPKYLVAADRHYEMAIKGATQMIPSLNVDNCQALYLVTVMVCFTAFAKGPSPGDLMVITDGNKVPWLALLRGVKMVLQTIGTDVVLSGILEPKPGPDCFNLPPRVPRHGRPVPWERSLDGLSDMIQSSAAPELAAMYLSNVNTLSMFFRQTYGTESNPKNPPEAEFSHIMGWIYRMDDNFIETLETRQPIALLILGHFAVFLQDLEHYWFMEGWGMHMVREIKRMVGPGLDAWLL